MTHDIYEARMLTEAARKYKVVTQMGNQGSSGDGVRSMREWYNAGLIGDATEFMYGPTGRFGHRVWAIQKGKDEIPKELIGIYGWDQQNLKNITKSFCRLTGVVTGLMAPVLWAIWVVT